MSIEEIAAEALPLHVYGDFLRDHVVDRGEQYSWEMVRLAVQHFNPSLPENIVRQWFDEKRNVQKQEWKQVKLPKIKEKLEADAQYYVRVHRGELEEGE